jgi:hypothetical protein
MSEQQFETLKNFENTAPSTREQRQKARMHLLRIKKQQHCITLMEGLELEELEHKFTPHVPAVIPFFQCEEIQPELAEAI